jgi:hypothetical protein
MPFTTDGCSLSPDGIIGLGDWGYCCLIHDVSYWQGGTWAARRNADEGLRECIQKSVRNSTVLVSGGLEAVVETVLGVSYKAGVRLGGPPKFIVDSPFPFKWGYGWIDPGGKRVPTKYQPHTRTETEQVFFRLIELPAEYPDFQRYLEISDEHFLEFKKAISTEIDTKRILLYRE